jgi:hypothetical protein
LSALGATTGVFRGSFSFRLETFSALTTASFTEEDSATGVDEEECSGTGVDCSGDDSEPTAWTAEILSGAIVGAGLELLALVACCSELGLLFLGEVFESLLFELESLSSKDNAFSSKTAFFSSFLGSTATAKLAELGDSNEEGFSLVTEDFLRLTLSTEADLCCCWACCLGKDFVPLLGLRAASSTDIASPFSEMLSLDCPFCSSSLASVLLRPTLDRDRRLRTRFFFFFPSPVRFNSSSADSTLEVEEESENDREGGEDDWLR